LDEGILEFLSTGAMYLVILAVIGLIFYELDKRLKAWLARPVRCAVCSTELGRERPLGRPPLCPSCSRQRAAERHR
jgi:hypothetical protein